MVRYDAKPGERSLDLPRWGLVPYCDIRRAIAVSVARAACPAPAQAGFLPSEGEIRRGSHGSAFLLLRVQPLEPLHRAGLGHGLNRLWLAVLRGGLCLRAAEFIETSTVHLRVEHFQGSAAGVDLIVMRKIGEAFENAKQLLVP